MDEIVRSIVIVGGFGFFNYWIATRIDDLDWGSTDDRKILIIFLSSMNYFIYTIIHQWNKNFICSLISTFLISLLLSLYLSTILKFLGNLINRLRKDEGLPPQTNVLVWNDMSKSDATHCFVFDFQNKIIASGAIHLVSGLNEEKSLDLWPHFNIAELYIVKDEYELYEILDKHNLHPRVYLNFEKQIKIIYF